LGLRYLKSLIITIFAVIWVVLIAKIIAAGGNMSSQIPKCIFTTLITFAILNAIVYFIDKKIKS